MMKNLFYKLLIVLLVLSACSQNKEDEKGVNSDLVMVCDSPGAYAYHNHHCHGLSSCDSQIINVSVEEAIKMERRECGFCYH